MSDIKKHPGMIAFWGSNVKTNTENTQSHIEEKKDEAQKNNDQRLENK